MDINVFQASIKDLDVVARLFNKYRFFYGQKQNYEGGKEYLKNRLNRQESIIFLATKKTERSNGLGFVQLYPSFFSIGMNHQWILNDLFVDEAARRHGVARQLMTKAKEFAVETEAIRIVLETDKDNYRAQQLYENIGYKRNEEHYYYELDLPRINQR